MEIAYQLVANVVALGLFCTIVWGLLARVVRDRTLWRGRTEAGLPIYHWLTPLGQVKTSRHHPATEDRRDDGGASGDGGVCGGDGGD